MPEITLNEFNIDNNTVSWNLNDTKFNIKYNFNINTDYVRAFKIIPLIQSCCLLSSIKKLPILNTDFVISEPEKELIEQYFKKQYVFNMKRLDIEITEIPKLIIRSSSKQFKEIVKTNIQDSTHVASSWSGGKDSLITLCLLEEIKYKVDPITTKWNTIAFNRGAHPFLKNHKIQPNIIASMSLGNKLKKLVFKILNEQNINIQIEKDSGLFMTGKDLPMMLYHSFYMNTQNVNNILYGMHNNIKYTFSGDEAEVNYIEEYCGFKLYENIGQGYNNKKIINKYLVSTYGKNVTSNNSILYPLYSPLIIKMLLLRYKRNDFSSCLTMINKVCNRCPKCTMSLIYCSALRINPSILGLNREKIIKHLNIDMTDSFSFPPVDESYWLINMCLYDKELYPILPYMVDSSPTNKKDLSFNPLIPKQTKYNTIPKIMRKKIVKIYNKYLSEK